MQPKEVILLTIASVCIVAILNGLSLTEVDADGRSEDTATCETSIRQFDFHWFRIIMFGFNLMNRICLNDQLGNAQRLLVSHLRDGDEYGQGRQ